jgi:predicted RNase H-related nuclease YkuK (DUF458 family)
MPQIKNFDEVREFIKSTSEKTAIYVGCDSRQVNDSTLFVVVIVVHIDSCRGAKVFWKTEKGKAHKVPKTKAHGGGKQGGLYCPGAHRCGGQQTL